MQKSDVLTLDEFRTELINMWGWVPYLFKLDLTSLRRKTTEFDVTCRNCNSVLHTTVNEIEGYKNKGYYCPECRANFNPIYDDTIPDLSDYVCKDEYKNVMLSEFDIMTEITNRYGFNPYRFIGFSKGKYARLEHVTCNTQFIATSEMLFEGREEKVTFEGENKESVCTFPYCPKCDTVRRKYGTNHSATIFVEMLDRFFEKQNFPFPYEFSSKTLYLFKDFTQEIVVHCKNCGNDFVSRPDALFNRNKNEFGSLSICPHCKGKKAVDEAEYMAMKTVADESAALQQEKPMEEENKEVTTVQNEEVKVSENVNEPEVKNEKASGIASSLNDVYGDEEEKRKEVKEEVEEKKEVEYDYGDEDEGEEEVVPYDPEVEIADEEVPFSNPPPVPDYEPLIDDTEDDGESATLTAEDEKEFLEDVFGDDKEGVVTTEEVYTIPNLKKKKDAPIPTPFPPAPEDNSVRKSRIPIKHKKRIAGERKESSEIPDKQRVILKILPSSQNNDNGFEVEPEKTYEIISPSSESGYSGDELSAFSERVDEVYKDTYGYTHEECVTMCRGWASYINTCIEQNAVISKDNLLQILCIANPIIGVEDVNFEESIATFTFTKRNLMPVSMWFSYSDEELDAEEKESLCFEPLTQSEMKEYIIDGQNAVEFDTNQQYTQHNTQSVEYSQDFDYGDD